VEIELPNAKLRRIVAKMPKFDFQPSAQTRFNFFLGSEYARSAAVTASTTAALDARSEAGPIIVEKFAGGCRAKTP